MIDERSLLLCDEVEEVYKHLQPGEVTGRQLLLGLNAPHRVLGRGYEVRAEHLAESLVAARIWPKDQNTTQA